MAISLVDSALTVGGLVLKNRCFLAPLT